MLAVFAAAVGVALLLGLQLVAVAGGRLVALPELLLLLGLVVGEDDE